MNKVLLIAFLGLISNLSFGQQKKVETVTIQTSISCDHCKKCESCGLNIYEHVIKNKGIKSVKIEDEINLITVKYKPKKITVAEIENAIAKAGFDANDTKADPEGYENLDSCCKKKNSTKD
jgi:copper chaperone CopZ